MITIMIMIMISGINMELISFSILISLVAIFISLPIAFFLSKTRSQSSMLPAGSNGWPIIGETFEFFKENFVTDRMEKYSSKVFKTSVIGDSVAVFCGPAGNKWLFSNENKLVTSWWPSQLKRIFASSTATSYEAEHLIAHSTLPEFYKVEMLQKFVGVIDSVAKSHFKAGWEDKKEVDVLPLSKRFTFSLGCKLFLSLDDPIQLDNLYDAFVELTNGYLSIPINFPGTLYNKALKASVYVRNELVQIIKQRKVELEEGTAAATQDALSQMLSGAYDGVLSTVEGDVANRLMGLLVGGQTASIVITFVIKYLAELPHVYDQVLKEQMEILEAKPPGELLKWEDVKKMKYSWNVIREVMRMTPPIAGNFREAITDFTYQGFTIPKGWKLYWSTYSTHRNADYFPDPDKFDPSRFEGNGPAPYTFVPFGGGPHMCPGKEYARFAMLVFTHNLVTKFKWDKMFPDEHVVLNATKMPEPVKGLPIRLEQHV